MRFSYLENVAYFCDLIHNEKTLSHAEHKPHRKECLFPCANSDPFVRKWTFLPSKLKILRMDATKIYSRLRFWYIAWKNNLAICLHLEYDYFHRPKQTTWQINNWTMFYAQSNGGLVCLVWITITKFRLNFLYFPNLIFDNLFSQFNNEWK